MPHLAARSLTRLAPAVAALVLGQAAACGDATGPGGDRVLTLHVAATRAPCYAMMPTSCLQVREQADQPWQLFYTPIEGFTHEAGYQYVLRVSRRAVPNPPADGSSFAYRLVAVVSKAAAP